MVGPGALKPSVGDGIIESRRPLIHSVSDLYLSCLSVFFDCLFSCVHLSWCV